MSNLFNLHLLPNNDDKRSYSKTKNTECIVCIKTNKKATQALKKLIKQNVINEFKRSNSFSPIKKIYDISVTESDIEKLIFGDWIKYNKEIDKKIGEQILKLLIDIFDKRYALYPNNICSLSEYSLQCQSKLNSICSKFKELSFYMLYKLYDQIIPFYKCLDKKLNFKTIAPIKYENIKEILYYISNDLSEIFKNPLEDEEGEDEDEDEDEEKYFKFSHILIVMLEDYLIKENEISDKMHLKTKSPLYKAKENFEKFLQLINNIYFIKDYEGLLKEKLSLVDEENIDKEDEKSSINIDNEKKNDNDNENNNEDNEGKENNKDDKNVSIEDLVNFINEPKKNENKKKRKKKNKNKKKKNEKKNNNNIEEDIDFLNYKKDIEVYTQNLPYVKKIRPKYSENFLKTMELLSQ